MHRLLERQLRRHFGKDFQSDGVLKSFLDIVDSYYHEVDREQQLLQNALSINTAELNAVNERMRAQNAEMTRTLLNTLSDGVYATDLQGKLTFMNAAAEQMLGWQEQELMGHPIHEMVQHHLPDGAIFPAEGCPQFRVIRDNEPIDGSGYFVARDDHFIPVDYRSRPIILEGKLIGALVSFQDISERKKNEQFIRQTQERLNLALDGSNLALWDWNIANDRMYLSDRWSLMMGGQRQETRIDTAQLFELVHPQDKQPLKEHLGAALKGLSEFYSIEFRVKRNDGSWGWVHTHGKVVERDAAGRALRMTGTNADITERKQAEEALHKSETKLRTLYDSTSDAVMLLDENGFFDCNKATLQMFGCTSLEDFITKQPSDFSPEKQPDGMDSMVLASQKIYTAMEKGSNRFEWVHKRADNGKVFDAEVLLNGMQLDGRTVLQATVRDITERKHAEMELRQAKEAAEQAVKIKGDFLANMSHEIRTPMNGIIGMTELALDTQLTPEQREYLSLVKSSSDALLGIVNDILDFSKIESGKLDIENIEFSLEHMLHATMKAQAAHAHRKNLELLLHVAPDVPDRLLGDPGRLRQVIVNLVSNAIKFTESGEIEVSVQRSDSTPEARTRLHFSVRDTGIGIPREKFKAIFDSFSQADTSTTRKYGGTGLGLTISAQLVELMGGKIALDSEVGKGSNFHFTLQMNTASAEPYASYQHTANIAGMTVLVVDDNATNRLLLQEILSSWKMLPTVVANGGEALDELERAAQNGKPYQMALLDVQMPGMNGFDLAERIRQHPDHVRATVMMLTSEGQRGHASRCRELGIASYLMKPVSPSELLDAIMTALGDQPCPSPALITRHSLQENQHKLNLLLAEDNVVNQTLAVRLLEKIGHRVTVANNGVEAVRHYQNGPFDAIIMDVDMPEMNGYEATQRIRELERESGRHIPIVAMTAHAMQGAREECLRHGMDGYLTKPINTDALWHELENLSPDKPQSAASAPSSTPQLAVADFDKALQTMDNNQELFDEIVRIFLEDAPPHMHRIKEGLAQSDSKAVRHGAHALKGMVGIFSAERTMRAAARVESMSGQEDCREAVAELEIALTELQSVIRDLTV